MRIRNETSFRRIARDLCHATHCKLENSGNASLARNGEVALIRSVLHAASEQAVVFDVGAHTGTYTNAWLRTARVQRKKVSMHLFEPQRQNCEALQEQFSNINTVHINAFGLSSTPSDQQLFKDREGSTLASLYQRTHVPAPFSKTETVALKRADQYIDEHKIKHVDHMKIDVEGHEIAVLHGLGKWLDPAFIDSIQFEYGGASIDARVFLRDFFSLLEPRGFVLAKIMPSYVETRTYHANMEDFLYQNWVALGTKYRNV